MNFRKIPALDIYQELLGKNFQFESFKVVCQVSPEFFEHAEFIGENTSTGQFFRFKLPLELVKPDLRLIKEFYEPSKRAFELITKLHSGGFSSSIFKLLVNTLWNDEPYWAIEEANESVNLKTLFTLTHNVIEAEYLGVCYSEIATLTEPVISPKPKFKDIRVFSHSTSLHYLMLQLFNMKKRLNNEAFMNSINALNIAGPCYIEALNVALSQAKAPSEIENIFYDNIPEEPSSSMVCTADVENEELFECDYDELVKLYLEDESGLSKKLVSDGYSLEPWEMLSVIMDSKLSSKFADEIEAIIDNFVNSEHFNLIGKDLAKIEELIETEVHFHLAYKLFNNENVAQLT